MHTYQLEIDTAVAALEKANGVVVVPTDTTYGIICPLDHPAAVDRIYDLKGRDRSKPLIILGSHRESLLTWMEEESPVADALSRRFWPGPLTIVAVASARVPLGILSGGNTVGLRVPDHDATRQVLSRLSGAGAASTSANPSGGGCPQTLAEVYRLMEGKIDYIMPDCEQAPAGTESTIVDISGKCPRILRRGSLDPELVLQCISESVV